MAKDIVSKIIIKNDTFVDWNKSQYTPKKGEIVAILKDGSKNPYGVVIGDGKNFVKNLPIIGIEHSLIQQYNSVEDLVNFTDTPEHFGYLNSSENIYEGDEDTLISLVGLFYYGYLPIHFSEQDELVLDLEGKGNEDTRKKYFYFFNDKKIISSFTSRESSSENTDCENTKSVTPPEKEYNAHIISEITFTDKITSIEKALITESSVRKSNIDSLVDDLAAEIERATEKEQSIVDSLNNEIKRATDKDSTHDSKIEANIQAINTEASERKTYDNYLYGETLTGAPEHTILDNYKELTKLQNKVEDVENTLDAIANVMEFVGAVEQKPDTTNYNNGDVIVVTSGEDAGKEFVLCGGTWVELGDTSAEQAAISQLQSDVEEINSEISIVKEDIKTNYVTTTYLNEELNKFEFDVNIDYGTKEEMEAVPDPQEGDIFLLRGEDEGGSSVVTTNPDEIIFSQGTEFLFTKPIGTVTQEDIEDGNGSTKRDASGMSITSFLASLFAEEENPTTPSTSASITSSNIGAKEVGEKIAVAYSFSTSAGSYKFGPENGVVFSNYSATFNGETLTTSSGTFKEVQVIDGMSLVITGSCSQSAGNIPVTNFGKEYPDAQIPEKEWTNLSKGTLTGYRAWFCGYKDGTNSLDDPTTITGEQIRALGNPLNGFWNSSMSVTKMKQMFFAAPKGKGYKPVIKDVSTTAPQTVLGPIVVSVPGANNYTAIDYDVYYVANDEAAAGSATLKITKS